MPDILCHLVLNADELWVDYNSIHQDSSYLMPRRKIKRPRFSKFCWLKACTSAVSTVYLCRCDHAPSPALVVTRWSGANNITAPRPVSNTAAVRTCSLQSVTVETNWRFKPKLPEPEYQSDNDCPSTFPNRPIKRMRVTRNMVINVYDDWEWIMLLWCRVLCHWTIMTRGNPARHSQEKH